MIDVRAIGTSRHDLRAGDGDAEHAQAAEQQRRPAGGAASATGRG